jgi:hypothetical protein
LPDGSLLPPAATALSLNTSRSSAKTTKLISVSTSLVIVYCIVCSVLFPNSSYAFCTYEWFNRKRVILHFTQLSVLSGLVGWCRNTFWCLKMNLSESADI